jgi:hypothetical protein
MLLLTLGPKLRQKLSRMLGPKAHTKALAHPIGLKYYLPNPTKFDTNFLPKVIKMRLWPSIQPFKR